MIQNGRQTNGHVTESILAQCCRDLGVSEPVAESYLEWSEERFGVVSKNGGVSTALLQSSVTIEQMARCLLKFKQPYMPMRVLFWAINSRVLDDALGHLTLTDIAKHCECTKQNVDASLRAIQRELNLPKRKTQRSAESRLKMSEKRKAKFIQ
jgi:hypothetical protein